MRVIQLLRKNNPAEWGGTETALQRLFEALRGCDVMPVVYCPRIENGHLPDPFKECGCDVRRFRACLPVWGISPERKRQLVAVGGNLLSFDLIGALWREPGFALMHAHTLGRLGGIALTVARRRRVPFVVTVHGGVLDLPAEVKNGFRHAVAGGVDWGKPFGLLLGARRLLAEADAIITCNPREAALLREQHPGKRIVVQPHGVPTQVYQEDHREEALAAFPLLHGRRVLLCVGRIDPVKNQGWLVKQAPALLDRHPNAILGFAGACTDAAYGQDLKRAIQQLGLARRVLLLGGFPSDDPRLIGLFQLARAVIVPSLSETFGLVILEAWAAGTTVIASRTSGATALIRSGHNGWLFDLAAPGEFHAAVDEALSRPALAAGFAANGAQLASTEHDAHSLAVRVKELYQQLIEEKHALRDSA
jgi:glycosyltransferase involved in cell wall biosynthesis